MMRVIYDSIYSWEGWGGKLRLAAGKCRLLLFDRSGDAKNSVFFLRPYVAIVSDVAESKMSVRSCAGHIASKVIQDFAIDPNRMLWVEYYPLITYGSLSEHVIPEQFVSVDFTWFKGKAINPKWRQLKPVMIDTIKEMMARQVA